MKFKKFIIGILVIVVLLGMAIYSIYERNKYTGYCQIEGTYRRRYLRCYGDYSPRAKREAQKQADYCNRSAEPVGGCTSKYR